MDPRIREDDTLSLKAMNDGHYIRQRLRRCEAEFPPPAGGFAGKTKNR